MTNGLFLNLCVCLLVLISKPVLAQEDYARPYNALLQTYVHAGSKEGMNANLVDYDAWAKDPRHAQAMNDLVVVDVATLDQQTAKAFWINAYNLLTIDLIIRNPEAKSIKDLGTLLQSPWKAHEWNIAGKSYTLDDIEHKILRKMGDPRIHMAIVCASLSCPDLREEVYAPEKLDTQLDDQARKFLSNSLKGMKVGASGIALSPIFKWFVEDFGGSAGVLNFTHKYGPIGFDDEARMNYFDYDWNLNKK